MDNITVDEKFKEIEMLIKELEKEDIGIEEALDKYTKAKVLIEECRGKIDTVEKEVLKLMPSGETEPFGSEELPF